MKQKNTLIILLLLFLASSCSSYRQFGAIATGSSLGGMFGSSIGGLMGGPRGSDRGTLTGMVLGGALGAVMTKQNNHSKYSSNDEVYEQDDYEEKMYKHRSGKKRRNAYAGGDWDGGKVDEPVSYGTYNSPNCAREKSLASDYGCVEVKDIQFLDSNNNHCLDAGEEATLVMNIYNRSDKTLYNVTPHIMCSSSKVAISPSATVEALLPGGGIRYKAMVRAPRRQKAGTLIFTVSFGTDSHVYQASRFRIQVQ